MGPRRERRPSGSPAPTSQVSVVAGLQHPTLAIGGKRYSAIGSVSMADLFFCAVKDCEQSKGGYLHQRTDALNSRTRRRSLPLSFKESLEVLLQFVLVEAEIAAVPTGQRQ